MKKLSEKIISPKYQGDDFEKKVKNVRLEISRFSKEIIAIQKKGTMLDYIRYNDEISYFANEMKEKYVLGDILNCAMYQFLIGTNYLDDTQLNYNVLDFKDDDVKNFMKKIRKEIMGEFGRINIDLLKNANKISNDRLWFEIKKEI